MGGGPGYDDGKEPYDPNSPFEVEKRKQEIEFKEFDRIRNKLVKMKASAFTVEDLIFLMQEERTDGRGYRVLWKQDLPKIREISRKLTERRK